MRSLAATTVLTALGLGATPSPQGPNAFGPGRAPSVPAPVLPNFQGSPGGAGAAEAARTAASHEEGAQPVAAVPSDEECRRLPRARAPWPFESGELLEYEIDVLTARAAHLSFAVLPRSGRGPSAELPVRARAQTHSVFAQVRRVKSQGTSYLRVADLRPIRMREDAIEDGVLKRAEVAFSPDGRREVVIDWRRGDETGQFRHPYAHDALDLIGAIYYFRAIPLEVGQSVCFDVYAIRRLWRLWGRVEARERVATPAGEFDTLHLAGDAARLDAPAFRRGVHVWLSDDPRRLPVAALGAIDLGPVRATLQSVGRLDRISTTAEPARPLRGPSARPGPGTSLDW